MDQWQQRSYELAAKGAGSSFNLGFTWDGGFCMPDFAEGLCLYIRSKSGGDNPAAQDVVVVVVVVAVDLVYGVLGS